MPPICLAGCLVFGQGALRHGFAERVVGEHPDDGQHDESRHAAYRPLEQEPLNGIANPARDEPAHHMVQREDAEEDNSYDNIWILLVGLRFADEEYHRQHRRADQERHFAGAAQRLDRLEAAHAAPEGHQGQAGEE